MTNSVRNEELPRQYEPPTVLAFDEVLGLTGGVEPDLANIGCVSGDGFVVNWVCSTGNNWV